MKKIFLSAAIAVFAMSNMNAQDNQFFGFSEGEVFIEGNVSFGSTNDKGTDTKTNGFGLSPKVGFFLNDDFAIGGMLDFSSYKQEVSGTDISKTSTVGAGVFGRYYFLDLGQRFKTYTELGIGFVTADDKIADVKVNGFGAGLDLGINYFVTEKIALSFTLDNLASFTTAKSDVSGSEATSDFNLGVGNISNPFGSTANFGVLFVL